MFLRYDQHVRRVQNIETFSFATTAHFSSMRSFVFKLSVYLKSKYLMYKNYTYFETEPDEQPLRPIAIYNENASHEPTRRESVLRHVPPRSCSLSFAFSVWQQDKYWSDISESFSRQQILRSGRFEYDTTYFHWVSGGRLSHEGRK